MARTCVAEFGCIRLWEVRHRCVVSECNYVSSSGPCIGSCVRLTRNALCKFDLGRDQAIDIQRNELPQALLLGGLKPDVYVRVPRARARRMQLASTSVS